MKSLPLKNGFKMPIIGFGSWQLTGNVCYNSVRKALEVGYRHIDTAERYSNHKEVGKAIKDSGIPREEIFLTSKVPPGSLHTQDVVESGKRYLKELGTEYLDLLLIHWPNGKIPIKETMEGFKKLKEEGLIRSIGVSNFTIYHLEKTLQTGVEFVNNQVEFHPSFNQKELKEFCDKYKILITAYSPVAHGQDLSLEKIQEIAKKYGKTPAQIILAWLMAKDIVPLSTSRKPDHIEDNFKSLEVKLTPEDLEKIDNIGGHNRTVNPPWAEFEK